MLGDKELHPASSKQLLLSPTLHLGSKFHGQPIYEELGPESALSHTHTQLSPLLKAARGGGGGGGMHCLLRAWRDKKHPSPEGVEFLLCVFQIIRREK